MRVGNDVVDLLEVQTLPGALHPRFDRRVFTARERDSIAAADVNDASAADGAAAGTHRTRWLLWAAKESAYKIAKKLNPETVFSPSRFKVEWNVEQKCIVRHGEDRFTVQFNRCDDFVHAVATFPSASGEANDRYTLLCRVQPLATQPADAKAPGLAVREMAARAIGSALYIDPEQIEVISRRRIPRARWKGSDLPLDLSLSHHGRFIAFALSYRI